MKPGKQIGNYKVLAELGTGAASKLYAVQDPKSKQVWALKRVVKKNPKDQRFLDQTEREAEVGSKVNHPNVRKVYKLIRVKKLLKTVEMHLLMELVDGISAELHPAPTLGRMLHIWTQVADGLAHMHQIGWVHADMKPHNIIVTESDVAKIIDLGQSCRVGTIKERIQGTPDYIAPEQVHRRAITPATDIYNFGASVYWSLTGKHIPTALARGNSLISGAQDDHLIERPVPPVELVPGTPELLNALILQCVEVDVNKRPDSMADIRDTLAEILEGLSESERDMPVQQRSASANSTSG
ncbi:MAG TPA: serine/threonine protein kinase [Phycisphaeraceae bacterium]|nr:serine/threonine protein kinase [Phycisphaeraceae bacterium]